MKTFRLKLAAISHTSPSTAQTNYSTIRHSSGEQCRPSQLAARLTALAAKQPTAAVVRADVGAPYKQVGAVMGACETAGIRQVSLDATK